MDDDDLDAWTHPELAEEARQYAEEVAASRAEQRRERRAQPAQRGRAAAAGNTAAGRRRATSDPGSRPRQRQRTPGVPSASAAAGAAAAAAGSASHSQGRTAASTYADGPAAGQAQAATPPELQDFFSEMQAASADIEAELAAAAAQAADEAAGEPSVWARRSGADEGRWRDSAPSLGAAVLQLHAAPDPNELCTACQQSKGCTIRCSSCCTAAGCVLLCDACDKAQHTHVHMHKRQEYSDSCWKDLPRADPDNGYFLFKPAECGRCHSSSITDTIVKSQALDYITLAGTVKAKRVAFECGNADCRAPVWQPPVQFLSVGAWPASLHPDNLRTVVAQDLLQLYSSVKLCSPTISLSAFVSALSDAACHSNLQQPVHPISTDAFRRAADEYSSCQLDLRLGVKQMNDLTCPACSKGGSAYHVDSNMKLFVWLRMRQLWRQPHFREFFAQDADVQLTIKAVDAARTGVGADADVADRSCNGVWTAAGDGQQRRISKQAVSGRCVATDARHGLPLAAANLVDSGERYGYALHLLVYHLRQCSQLHIDIMCKWGPWLQRTVAALLQDPPADASSQLRARILELRQLVTDANGFEGLRKVLSHAHGTLHSLNCQVLWQPGWTPYCAKTLGEEGEQFFSYWSKYAFTTRNQSVAGAEDQLTKGAFHFSRLKLQQQAALLVARRRKFAARLPQAEAKRDDHLQLLVHTSAAARPALVDSMREALTAHAQDEVGKTRDGNKKLLEQYSEAVRVRQGHDLSAALTASLARVGMQSSSVAAVHVMAGLMDPNVVVLHDTISKLCQSAQANRAAAEQADVVIREKFAPALDASIVQLQNVIEGLCHDLKKSEAKRDAKAATPKERQRHNKKCKEVVSALAQRVQQYNVLVAEYNKHLQSIPAGHPELASDATGARPWDKARNPTTLEDVRKQQFSWVDEYSFDTGHPLRLYGVARAMAVCEADNEVARIKEELALLPQEMQAHVEYYRGLGAHLSQLEVCLAPTSAATAEDLLAAGYTPLQGAGRYQPGMAQLLSDDAVRSGALTFVRLAQVEVQQQLDKAIRTFAKAGVMAEDVSVQGDVSGIGSDADSEDGDWAPPSGGEDDAAGEQIS